MKKVVSEIFFFYRTYRLLNIKRTVIGHWLDGIAFNWIMRNGRLKTFKLNF